METIYFIDIPRSSHIRLEVFDDISASRAFNISSCMSIASPVPFLRCFQMKNVAAPAVEQANMFLYFKFPKPRNTFMTTASKI